METELATDNAGGKPPYQGHSSESSTSIYCDDTSVVGEQMQASGRPHETMPQRVRAVRLTTRLHPDMLIPYLYGEKSGRSINAIVNATGCTIDYCALSPDELEQSPESHGYVMNFLVSAGSRETLEDTTSQLRTLVERVQVHLQKKARGSSRGDDERDVLRYESKRMADTRLYEDVTGKRGRIRHKRWAKKAVCDGDDSSWGTASRQKMYFASAGPRVCRERPRFVKNREIDEKREFVATQGRVRCAAVVDQAAQAEALYVQQRNQSLNHFFTRRRVQRYPEYDRWMPGQSRGQVRGRAGYTMHEVASPHGENEEPYENARNIRQSHYIYEGTPKHFAQTECSLYEYDEPRHDNDADLFAYGGTPDLTNENTGPNEAREFIDPYQSVRRPHSRRHLKRPLSKMLSDGPPPPTIYRRRMPYVYDYMYDDEDYDWVSEDEEVEVGDGYPPPFRPAEIPVLRRNRRFESSNVQQWSSPAGARLQPMYKRRRIPHEGISLNNEMTDEVTFETRNREHVSSPPPNIRTVVVEQLDALADKAGVGAFPDHPGTFAGIHAEVRSTPSSPSVAHTDSADLDTGQKDSVATEIPSQHDVEVLADLNVNNGVKIPARETLSEQQAVSPNEENLQSTSDNATADEHPIEHASQSEVEHLALNVSIQETTASISPQSLITPMNSPTSDRETPDVGTPSSIAKNADRNAFCRAADAMKLSAGRQADVGDAEVLLEEELPVQVPVLSEFTIERDCSLREEKLNEPTAGNIVTDTIRINNHAIASLERLNKVEADFMIAKSLLLAQEDKLRQVENSSKSWQRLETLCGIVYDLQCHVGSHSCGLNASCQQDMLGKVDNCLETISIQNEQTLQEKVNALQAGIELVLAVDRRITDDQVVETEAVKLNGVLNSNTMSPVHADVHRDRRDDANNTVWEDDDWFEEEAFGDPASESDEQENVVSSEKSNPKFEGDIPAVKIEEGLSRPRELPPFVWSLLARVTSSDPQSHVMRVTLKRLLDEIAKGDPYHYLHPTNVFKDADVSSPLHSSPSSGCEFGCRGASALKWEQKLVSQISSRMKSFDNVAYSLARSSGGKEALNRKKMNSIIRKLHLVAMQLHSLLSHLYCVKGHAACKEVDSLPIALNNSHFERKMGVYKSRLKLVAPHTYQLQTQHEQQGLDEPAEELLRDTYEFFPELLLCIDIWGYNYRESLVKRHNGESSIGGTLAGSGAISKVALFPIRYFCTVESLAFDFENDSNGLLHCICDELLNIVCLWNDFKWTDNLEAVALDRVMSFESDVTASILKILELYAHHLQALWSVRLLDEPDQLRSIHFTEFNAYYSDRSQGSLNTTVCSQSRAPGASEINGNGSNCDLRSVIQHETTEKILEQHLAEEYWNRKVTALSILNPGNDAMEAGADSKLKLLSVEAICSWDQHTLVSYLLRWSDVYSIRTEVNALSAVTNHMMKHEVQKFRFVDTDDASVTGGSNVNNTMVDSSTRQLLAAVGRAQMLIRDALIGSEKLALHSASNQLPNEKKRLKPVVLEVDKAGGRGSETSSLPSCQTLAHTNDADAHSGDAALETVPHVEAIASKNVDSCDAIEDVNIGTGMTAEQPELKDLIQLLAVTSKDMQELCGRRPRSARMREKVQMQALQLARQTVEIFRNTRNMYASRRR